MWDDSWLEGPARQVADCRLAGPAFPVSLVDVRTFFFRVQLAVGLIVAASACGGSQTGEAQAGTGGRLDLTERLEELAFVPDGVELALPDEWPFGALDSPDDNEAQALGTLRIAPGHGRGLRVRVPRGPGQLHVESSAGEYQLVAKGWPSGETWSDGTYGGDTTLDLADRAGEELALSIWAAGDEAVALDAIWFELPAPPVNLVLIVVDTLRFDALSPTRTPAISALAGDGVSFTQSFSHAPMTLPSHTALFTSKYPHATGIVVNGQDVPEELVLLSEWMGAGGYRTQATASLATLWQSRKNEGLDQGFQDFRVVERDYSHGLDTARLFGEQLEALANSRAAPLLLFVHLADPHEPYRSFANPAESLSLTLDGEPVASADPQRAPHVRRTFELKAGPHELVFDSAEADFVLRSLYLRGTREGRDVKLPVEYLEGQRLGSQRRLRARFVVQAAGPVRLESWVTDHPTQKEAAARYLDEVQLADEAVGRIVQELKSRGLYDSSLVIFTSDHGEAFGEHQLNGHSHNLFDELLHVPLVIKPPTGARFDGVRESLRQSADQLVRHVDLAPTALDVLGLPQLPGSVGRSLLAAGDEPRRLLAETHVPEATRDSYALRDAYWKLILTPETQQFQLFDLTEDPLELHDLFLERGAEFLAWQQELLELAGTWEQRDAVSGETERGRELEALGY